MFKEKLVDDYLWNEYLVKRTSKDFISDKEKEKLSDFVLNKKYKDIVNKIFNDNFSFSTPKKHLVNKGHSNRKRIVYTYSEEEMQILKYISYLLYDYDYLFSKNLYSFRKNISVKNAIKSIAVTKNIKNMYGYKVDIKNYFNSINIEIILNNLKEDIKDKDLYNLINDILSNPDVIYENKIIKEVKGVIAGNPLSAFLANYYLREIDEYFWNQKVFYIRYADDIIIFANTKEEVDNYKEKLYELIDKYKLMINHNKEYFYNPGDTFEFLGFSFEKDIVDLSSNTVYKIKKKIRRSARGMRRWSINKGIDFDIAIKAMNKKFNRKFYGTDDSELTWRFWFFPSINTIKSLELIDHYYQDELRYIVTGKHNKKNFKKVPYIFLKECNYKSLVHEYYELKLNMENNFHR